MTREKENSHRKKKGHYRKKDSAVRTEQLAIEAQKHRDERTCQDASVPKGEPDCRVLPQSPLLRLLSGSEGLGQRFVPLLINSSTNEEDDQAEDCRGGEPEWMSRKEIGGVNSNRTFNRDNRGENSQTQWGVPKCLATAKAQIVIPRQISTCHQNKDCRRAKDEPLLSRRKWS
jgi:hypothetical protein